MFFKTTFPNGVRFNIIVGHEETIKLQHRSFRGPGSPYAGNFFGFSRVEYVVRDRLFFDDLRVSASQKVREMISRGKSYADFSCTFDCGKPVGWASTLPLALVPADALEPFEPNRHSRALRVKPGRTDIVAPLTNLVTFACQVRCDKARWKLIIHTLYPGEDVGPILGDVTQRSKRAFLDWNHPGMPIRIPAVPVPKRPESRGARLVAADPLSQALFGDPTDADMKAMEQELKEP